jgi:hypothetical protein
MTCIEVTHTAYYPNDIVQLRYYEIKTVNTRTLIETYSYDLLAQPAALGGGWLLRLSRNGFELGRRVFPPVTGIKDERQAAAAAHHDALARATTWLASIEARPPSMRPRPAGESGLYLLMPDDELLCPELRKGTT